MCLWTDDPDLVKRATEVGEVILPLKNFADQVSLEVQATFCAGGKFTDTPYPIWFIYKFSGVCTYSGLC